LFGLFAVANLAFVVIGLAKIVDDPKGGLTFLLVGLLFLATFGALAYAHAYAGFMVTAGRARHLQTVLATMHLPNLPLGTAYGAFALWVCYFNPDTTKIFERPAGRRVV
jgi:uncharacterized membrane protein YecN with MAPEG domain